MEVIRGYYTSDETIAVAMDLARKFKKEPIEVKKDIPCFVVNRLMMPHFIEAIWLLQEGIASAEDIDKAAKLGLNYPMGPFELMDLTGIDIAYHVAEYLHKEMNKELKWVSPRMTEGHGQGKPPRHENRRRLVRLSQEIAKEATHAI